MRDEADPPRKHYQLRPTTFERVNPLPPPAPDIAVSRAPTAPVDGPIDVTTLARQAMSGGPLLNPPTTPTGLNEVQEMLRDNVTRANAAGINDVVAPAPRRSRRKRDYWLLIITLNAFFATVAFGPYRNPMTLTYGIAGMIVVTLGLTWVMWFIMEDY